MHFEDLQAFYMIILPSSQLIGYLQNSNVEMGPVLLDHQGRQVHSMCKFFA